MNDQNVTQLLQDLRAGDQYAAEILVPKVYNSLNKLAGQLMRGERHDHTLQATAMVNECYLQLVDMPVEWQSRAHFFAIAVRQMRRILVDYARARRSQKRGGDQQRQTLDDVLIIAPELDVSILDLDKALSNLSEFDDRKSQVVELHFFGGLTYDEIAEALNISAATVDRELRLAKAWLYRKLGSND